MYYSVIVNPCGYVNFELMGSKVSDASLFKSYDKMRFSFKSRHQKPSRQVGEHLTALKVSRGTARMAQVKEFYSSDIGADTLVNKKYDDGSELLVIMYDKPTKGIQIHFWSGVKA